ncbi:hypothetical protein BZG02_13970 [Labilibaculum filiforme]|uniref:Host attachment protein n=1 Tax=Labilibaculum filiforme TaxID=1940526 RepID=A0A2N3HVJ0_9BACT|nr:hypothetical protein [Labilibaculum filiforme]PKQ62041.1 hypothetical protein BZG02_13970 [Labilibaculum filiforme]
MKKNIGVWLDTEKAYIITIEDNGARVDKIESDIESRLRFKGETKPYSRMGNQFINPATKITHKRRHQMKHYFEAITDHLYEAEEIYLFGPAETKVHLAKHISKEVTLKDRIRKIESEDHLTENQMIACVKKVFEQKPVKVNVRIRH